MSVINVVEVENNRVVGISSFAIIDPQEDGIVIQEAESCFAETLRQKGVSEDVIEEAIEDEFYQMDFYSLSLVWSSINNALL